MSAEIDDGFQKDISCAQASEALELLLADTRFNAGGRQRAILSYLVSRRFEHEDVKAYVIAVDVLGRPTNFNAAIDPIVRIEMSRLRSTLESFYAAFGDDHDVWISITKGKYIACFTRKPCLSRMDMDREEVDENQPQTGAHPDNHRHKVTITVLSAIACGAIAFASLYACATRTVISEKPIVYVYGEAADPRQSGEASQMRDALLTALTQFQTMIVAQPGYAAVRGRAADPKYSIHFKYYGGNDDRSVWWQVTESSSGKLQAAGLVNADTGGKNAAVVREEVVTALAKRIASNHGVINSIELDADPGSLGNGCVIRAELAIETRTNLNMAIDCLQRTVRLTPDNSDAKALLARALLVPEGRATPPDVADHALDLARDAVVKAPLSGRAQLALMAARAAKGSMESAIDAGNKALALNPYSSDAAAALGGILYSAGYRAAGLSMAIDASKNVDVIPRCALIVQALEAFRHGRYTEAIMWTERVNGSSSLTRVIRSAAFGELGSVHAKDSLENLDVSPSGLKKTVEAVGLQPDLVSMLEQGLSKAKADFQSVGSISQ